MQSLGFYLLARAFVFPRRLPDSRYAAQAKRGLVDSNHQGTKNMLSLLWTIFIGFIAGVIAKFVTPGDTHEPQGFILTTALGIVGALVATYLGQAVGWYEAGQGAGFIASIVGAVLILLVWGFIASRRT
jgi:uncharacterized membrane protein YeaQ/YmgE (transglycosylase-associated protein family)